MEFTHELETMKIVEYMLPSMSTELLHKFPDNSAFDFDYTQSSIWSPLVPHPSTPSSPVNDIQRKLSFEETDDVFGVENVKKGKMVGVFSGKTKDKIMGSCVFGCLRIHGKFSNKKVIMGKRWRSGFRGLGQLGSGSSGLVVDSGCSSPIQSKGWKKVLKAASKQFKKTMKKKDSGNHHLKLSSNGYSNFTSTYYY